MLIVAHIEEIHSRRELPGVFARTREAGFDGVEIVIGRGRTCDLSEPEENCREIALEADRCGSRVQSAVLADDPAVCISHTIPESAGGGSRVLEQVRAVVQRCRWLGAQTLRLTPAGAGPHSGPYGGQSYQDALNQTCSNLEALHADFERCGVVAGVVPCHHRFLLSPPEFRELIDRVNSPMIGAALDWTACAQVGDPADWITTLQRRLAAVTIDAAAWRDLAAANGRVRCADRAEENAAALPDRSAQRTLRALRDIRFDGLLICLGDAYGTGELNTLRSLFW